MKMLDRGGAVEFGINVGYFRDRRPDWPVTTHRNCIQLVVNHETDSS